MSTEKEGPFFIERNGDLVVVRSKIPFSAIRVYSMASLQQGVLYVLPPMTLHTDMRLILSAAGHDDVVVTKKGNT